LFFGAGISFSRLRRLIDGVERELHHGRSAEVDELISSSEMPLMAEGLLETHSFSMLLVKAFIYKFV